LKGSDYLVANPSTKISDRITGINKDNGHDYHASSEEEFTVDDEGKGDDDDDEEEDIITPSSPLTEAKLKGQYHMNSPRKPTLKKKPSKKKNIDTIDEAMTSDSDEDEFGGVEETSVGRRGTITPMEIVGCRMSKIGVKKLRAWTIGMVFLRRNQKICTTYLRLRPHPSLSIATTTKKKKKELRRNQ
jgi:hypothetical protein